MPDIKDMAINLFINRLMKLKPTEIKWPAKMDKQTKITFIDNLLEISEMQGDTDNIINLNLIKKKIQGMKK